MRQLVEEGRERITTTSKVVGGLGNVVGYIGNVKSLIGAAIASVPQAALPWAGVCISLQVSYPDTVLPSFGVASALIFFPDSLQSRDGNQVQPYRYCLCNLKDGLVLRIVRSSPG